MYVRPRRSQSACHTAYTPMIAPAIASGYSVVTAKPASNPASSRSLRLGCARSRSRHASANAANASSAESTWLKRFTANGITSVAPPSVTAVIVPRPGSMRSTTRRVSSRSSSAGNTVPSSPSAHTIGAWISRRRLISAARCAL